MNVKSMAQHGTVAVLTMFGTWYLFGTKHIMLAFPIALTSAVLSRQNLRIKTLKKIVNILIIDVILVLLAYLATINVYLCITVNLITIFFIAYSITSSFDPTFYKPFLMIFVFSQGSLISLNELYARLISVFLGVIILVIGETFINKVKPREQLNNNISSGIRIIDNQLNNMLNNEFQESTLKEASVLLKELGCRVYITRSGEKLTTNLGKIQFDYYIILEHFNLFLREFHYKMKENDKLSKIFIVDLRKQLKNIILYSKNFMFLNNLNNSFRLFLSKYDNMKENITYINEVVEIMININLCVNSLSQLEKRSLNKVYDQWERSSMDRFKNLFRENLTFKSIRLNFALRMAIALTGALYISMILGFFKIIWVIITIMSVMQPYYEDTIYKSKGRIKGNILSLIFTASILNIADNKNFTMIILIISLYFVYAFKDYYKISIFTATASLCISSLSTSVNVLSLYRIAYVIIGIIIVVLANKFIFPYRLRDGIESLINKIIRYNEVLLKEGIIYIKNIRNVREIRDLVIHQCVMSQKLYLRNMEIKDEKVEKLMDINNKFTIDLAYTLLIKKRQEIFEEKILNRVIDTGKEFIEGLKPLKETYIIETIINKEKFLGK